MSTDEEDNQTEEHDIAIDYVVREPEVEDSTYKSKAALQISKAIGTQQILTDYDNIRTQLKHKAATTEGVKPSLSEKWKYDSLLSQLRTQLLSTK